MGRGFFIVIEGIDGVGKTTIISNVCKKLSELGYETYITKEPSNSLVGNFIKSILRSEVEFYPQVYALLFTADRYQHYFTEILPILEKKSIVLCERFVESTITYQGALGLSQEWIEELNKYLQKPDLTIILDASIEVVRERLKERGRLERFEKDLKLLEKVRQLLLERALKMNYIVIDTVGKGIEEVSSEVLKHIILHIRKRG